MMEKWSKYRLMAPGPVALPQEVLQALSEPMIHHRTDRFKEIFANVLNRLPQTLKTEQPVMVLPGTGSMGLEAALVNTLSPQDRVLVINSGKFGERWAQTARAHQLNVTEWSVPWGEKLDLEAFEVLLQQEKGLKAILTQSCETSTATLHPIREMAQLVKAHTSALFMVDAITSIGASPYAMDDWRIDVTVAGSQKAFMLPTGLSFIALSERAWHQHSTARCPRFYTDLAEERKANRKNQTRFSACVSHIRALDKVLDRFCGPHMDQSILRCQQLMKSTHAAAKEYGLTLFSKSPAPSVTALNLPDDLSGEELRDRIESDYNITLIGGQGDLRGKIIRWGHLGDISDDDQLATVEALGLELQRNGQAHEASIQAALREAQKVLTE